MAFLELACALGLRFIKGLRDTFNTPFANRAF